MSGDRSALDWYRDRIREKRCRATTLTIEIGLNAQDKDDEGTLVQTMERLDSAIRILEEADAIVMAASELDAGDLMDDLGHSMSPLNLADKTAEWQESLHFFA
jgi:hypothetical protein